MSNDLVIYKGSRSFVVDVISDIEKRVDALEAARQSAGASKRAALTEEQWRSIRAPTGNRLFDAGVHHACVSIRELLARASGKEE